MMLFTYINRIYCYLRKLVMIEIQKIFPFFKNYKLHLFSFNNTNPKVLSFDFFSFFVVMFDIAERFSRHFFEPEYIYQTFYVYYFAVIFLMTLNKIYLKTIFKQFYANRAMLVHEDLTFWERVTFVKSWKKFSKARLLYFWLLKKTFAFRESAFFTFPVSIIKNMRTLVYCYSLLYSLAFWEKHSFNKYKWSDEYRLIENHFQEMSTSEGINFFYWNLTDVGFITLAIYLIFLFVVLECIIVCFISLIYLLFLFYCDFKLGLKFLLFLVLFYLFVAFYICFLYAVFVAACSGFE